LDLAVERLERLPALDQVVVLALRGEGDGGRARVGGRRCRGRAGVRFRPRLPGGCGCFRGRGGIQRRFAGDRLVRGRVGSLAGGRVGGRCGGGRVRRGRLAGGQQQHQGGGGEDTSWN